MPDIDHSLMAPPSLRVTHMQRSTAGDGYVWDLRIAQPNVSHISMPVIHSIEHFLGSILRESSSKVLVVAPMGCQTGFYIVTLGISEFNEISELIADALQSILDATEVPLANTTQCGWAVNHSLVGAKNVAGWLLSRRHKWGNALAIPYDGRASGVS
jgi:S-ribosylhomocysteine lyase